MDTFPHVSCYRIGNSIPCYISYPVPYTSAHPVVFRIVHGIQYGICIKSVHSHTVAHRCERENSDVYCRSYCFYLCVPFCVRDSVP
mmetsp:Transcript_95582/g.164852  ORF Transcript_95582/g.164852 Transcript_95582/m.164852 type:complete len:86 (-) Transcript_95582:387-644(-)